MSANTLEQRITDYLSGGGLFNPELANHDEVRDLLIECRAALASRDGEAVAQIVSSGPANMPLLRWLSADHSFRAPIGSRLYAAPLSQPKPLEELPPLPLAGEFIPGANKRSILLFTADQMRAYAAEAVARALAASAPSREAPELAPQTPGQALMMTMTGEGDASDGHWYSPSYVRALLDGTVATNPGGVGYLVTGRKAFEACCQFAAAPSTSGEGGKERDDHGS